MKKTILITGTLGFIGSNFVRQTVEKYSNEYRFVGVDKGVYAYNLNNAFEHPNYKFYLADITDAHIMNNIFFMEKPHIVIGMAAESFVDNSITDIMPFLNTNVIGTQILVNMCLKHNVENYFHVSTDEVYGQQLSMNAVPWTESCPLEPRNPYAASKAAAEFVVKTAHETHGLRYQMSRACNVFGPRQKKENLIPHIINKLINNEPINIHGNGLNFRQYIYVDDKIDAIMKIISNGNRNEVYNIGDINYSTNLDMAKTISHIMKLTAPVINFITDRKAHDFGYKVSTAKLKHIGWFPGCSFQKSLEKTVKSYMENL